MKDTLVKFLVEIVEAVIECENDELRESPGGDVERDLLPPAVAVRQLTLLPVAPGGRVSGHWTRPRPPALPLGVGGEVYQDLSGVLLGLLRDLLGGLKHVLSVETVGVVVIVLELIVDVIVPLGVVEGVTVEVVPGVVQVLGLSRVGLEEREL